MLYIHIYSHRPSLQLGSVNSQLISTLSAINIIMSSIISAIFILFCLCMHYSSTALRLLPAADYKAFEEHHIKVAEHEKVKVVVANTPNSKGGLKALKKKMEINGKEEEEEEEEEEEMNSGAIPTNSDLVSLLSSGDHAHVLYADYSRPRTRPPSHN